MEPPNQNPGWAHGTGRVNDLYKQGTAPVNGETALQADAADLASRLGTVCDLVVCTVAAPSPVLSQVTLTTALTEATHVGNQMHLPEIRSVVF